MATHTLRLIKGDKISPTTTVDLASVSGGITPAAGGFTPVSGDKDFVWSGRSSRFDGQRLITTSRDNAQFTLEYNLHSDSYTGLMTLQKPITKMIEDAERYELRREGEPIWLEYGWGTAGLGIPVLGQMNHYCRVLGGFFEWPDNLQSAALVGNVIERIKLTLFCEPYAEGRREIALSDYFGPHNLSDEMMEAGDYIIGARLVAPNPISDFIFYQVWSDTTHNSTVFYDHSLGTIGINHNNSTDGDYSATLDSSVAFVADEELSFAVVSTDSPRSLKFYLNGTEKSSLGGFTSFTDLTSPPATLRFDTTFTSGSPNATLITTPASDVLMVFAASGGGNLPTEANVISIIPSTSTPSAIPKVTLPNNPIENDSGNNYLYVENVPGDVPALTEWQLSPPTSSPSQAYWIGIKAVESTLTDPEMFWLEFQGTVEVLASEGEIERISQAAEAFHSKTITDDIAEWPGRYQVLANMNTSRDLTGLPFYRFGADVKANVFGASDISLPLVASPRFRDLGEIFIRWYGSTIDHIPTQIIAGVKTSSHASSTDRDVDFLMFMPYPFVRIGDTGNSITFSSGDKIVVSKDEAWVQDTNGDVNIFLEARGEANLIPGKINYVYFIQANEGDAMDVSDTMTVDIYITPRYQLPGLAIF